MVMEYFSALVLQVVDVCRRRVDRRGILGTVPSTVPEDLPTSQNHQP